MCVFFQPGLDNVQASLQRRSTSLAEVQSKINKLEDEVHMYTSTMITFTYSVHPYILVCRCFVTSVEA